MPLEVALLATREHTLDELRALAETMEPPLLVRDTVREGTVTVTELDETAVATLGRPRRVETVVDLVRAYGPTATLPDGQGFVTEAIVPFEYRRGMALVFALEHMLAGTAVVRGMDA
jgi:urease gamma subunit